MKKTNALSVCVYWTDGNIDVFGCDEIYKSVDPNQLLLDGMPFQLGKVKEKVVINLDHVKYYSVERLKDE